MDWTSTWTGLGHESGPGSETGLGPEAGLWSGAGFGSISPSYTVNDQLVARAFILQNPCGPRAFKRDQAAIGNRLLFILAPANTGPLLFF